MHENSNSEVRDAVLLWPEGLQLAFGARADSGAPGRPAKLARGARSSSVCWAAAVTSAESPEFCRMSNVT